MKPEPRRLRELRWVIDHAIATVGGDLAFPLFSGSVLGATCPEIKRFRSMAFYVA